MSGPPVVLHISDGVGHVTLDRPDRGNPFEAQIELAARAMARVCRTEDAWTGVTEVAARRVPRFRGE